MTMTIWQGAITIVTVVLGTMCTRFLPFLVFPESKQPPRIIEYFGQVLPYAMTSTSLTEGGNLLSLPLTREAAPRSGDGGRDPQS